MRGEQFAARQREEGGGSSAASRGALDGLDLIGQLGVGALTELGHGEGSIVFAGVQEHSSRQLAIKVYRRALTKDDQRRQFDDDYQTLCRLAIHPNIVNVFGSGFNAAQQPAIAMAMCPGGTLEDRLAMSGATSVDAVLDLGIRLCSALDFAHCHDVLHRNVSPANILIDPLGGPVFSEFGIRAGRPAASLRHGRSGSRYDAPEVARDATFSVASDIWSLAATMYALLFGSAPSESMNGLHALADRVVSNSPTFATGGALDGFIDVMSDALSNRPAKRPASAARFAAQLQDVQRRAGLPATGYVDLRPSPVEPGVIKAAPAAVAVAETVPAPRAARGGRVMPTGLLPTSTAAAAGSAAPTGVPPGDVRPTAHHRAPKPSRPRGRALVAAAVILLVLLAVGGTVIGMRAAGRHSSAATVSDQTTRSPSPAVSPSSIVEVALPQAQVRSRCLGLTCTFNAVGDLPAGASVTLTFPNAPSEKLGQGSVRHRFADAGRFVVVAQVVEGSRRGPQLSTAIVVRDFSRSLDISATSPTSRSLLVRITSSQRACQAGFVRLERQGSGGWSTVASQRVDASGVVRLLARQAGLYRAGIVTASVSGGQCRSAHSGDLRLHTRHHRTQTTPTGPTSAPSTAPTKTPPTSPTTTPTHPTPKPPSSPAPPPVQSPAPPGG